MTTALSDRLAVITGAAGGIGREIAICLAGEGMRLALLDRDGDGLRETAGLMAGRSGTGSAARPHVADVTSDPAMTAAARDITDWGGVPAVLVNSAGILGPFDKRAWELSADDWQRVLSVDLLGVVNTVRAFLPAMHSAGEPARVVILASMAGVIPERRAVAYGAAKHALVSYGETLRIQLASENSAVGVTLACPGGVPTNFNRLLRESPGPGAGSGRSLLSAEEVARQIVAAVLRGAFYVFTHPDSAERLALYHETLREATT